MTIQNQSGETIIRYENKGTTRAERKAICLQNMAKFGRDAKAGKLLCLSDLIGQAEQVHIDNMENA